MSKLGSLEKVCDPASLDGLISEFSRVAKRAFEEEGFDPVTVEEILRKMEAEAEASFAAMGAAQDEQLAAADALLNEAMDSGMAQLDEITEYGSEELKTLSALETAALKVSKRLTATAAAAANRYLDAALASAAAAYAAKSVHKNIHTHFFPGSRVYSVSEGSYLHSLHFRSLMPLLLYNLLVYFHGVLSWLSQNLNMWDKMRFWKAMWFGECLHNGLNCRMVEGEHF